MNEALETFRNAYADPYAAARAHHEVGGKVIGYFLNSVPEELIVAADCFPVRLRGDWTHRSAIAERYMEQYMDGEVRSIFGALLEGRFDFVDLIVIPRNSEVYLQLYYFLLEIPKWETQLNLPPIFLFDLLQTPTSATLNYVTGRLHAFAKRLKEVSGREICATALSQAIRRSNAKRAALQRASALWQARERSLTGVDALHVIASASFMRDADFIQAIAALIENPPPPSPVARPRILIKGSPQSDHRFTALMEDAGADVVGHDHLWGDRIYAATVRERSEPWRALAQHYCFDIPSPREYPQAKADEQFLDLAKRAAVHGVIFFHDEWDDTLGWEYPDQKKLLDKHGTSSLFLKRQRYFDPDESHQLDAVRAFIDQLKMRL